VACDDHAEPQRIACRTCYHDRSRELASPIERANPSLVQVGELVRARDVVCITPDLPIDRIARLFVHRDLSFAPCVGPSVAVLGVSAKTDLVPERAAVDVTAAEILSPLVWKVPESASLAVAIELMVEHGIHQVPIVSADGAVVGVLGALDVVR